MPPYGWAHYIFLFWPTLCVVITISEFGDATLKIITITQDVYLLVSGIYVKVISTHREGIGKRGSGLLSTNILSVFASILPGGILIDQIFTHWCAHWSVSLPEGVRDCCFHCFMCEWLLWDHWMRTHKCPFWTQPQNESVQTFKQGIWSTIRVIGQYSYYRSFISREIYHSYDGQQLLLNVVKCSRITKEVGK